MSDPNVNTQAEIYEQVRTLALKDAEICALGYALRCTHNGYKAGADVAADIAKEIAALKRQP